MFLTMKLGVFCSTLFMVMGGAPVVWGQVCGDGAIDSTEGCDDGNLNGGDGCDAACAVEPGWFCVPSLYASGVNPGGIPLATGSSDPHWTWSLSPNGTNATPGYVARHPAWANLPPGNWMTTDATFGAGLTSQANTYWFQDVFMPASFAGNLTFPVAVAADNAAEVFVNGTSYGNVSGFGRATSVSIPSSAFVPGNNVISIRLNEFIPGTPRGILMYPGGGGILSQCTRGCEVDPDCDDGNPCTIGTCLSGACDIEILPLGMTCTATIGNVCGPADPIPFCLPCVDTATTTTATIADLGCGPGLPFCNTSTGTPTCVECETGDHCPFGFACMQGTCVANLPPDAGVVDAGQMDTGVEGDAETMDSGAIAMDSGAVMPDASPEADADTPSSDASTPSADASAPASDAGSSGTDAGGLEDGDEGCACSSSEPERRHGGWILWALGAGVLFGRRRR